MSNVRAGQRIITKSSYQARGFVLANGEAFPADASVFDRNTHTPRLLQIEKGQQFEVLGGLENGQVFVRTEREGSTYACLLLPDSFYPA